MECVSCNPLTSHPMECNRQSSHPTEHIMQSSHPTQCVNMTITHTRWPPMGAGDHYHNNSSKWHTHTHWYTLTHTLTQAPRRPWHPGRRRSRCEESAGPGAPQTPSPAPGWAHTDGWWSAPRCRTCGRPGSRCRRPAGRQGSNEIHNTSLGLNWWEIHNTLANVAMPVLVREKFTTLWQLWPFLCLWEKYSQYLSKCGHACAGERNIHNTSANVAMPVLVREKFTTPWQMWPYLCWRERNSQYLEGGGRGGERKSGGERRHGRGKQSEGRRKERRERGRERESGRTRHNWGVREREIVL